MRKSVFFKLALLIIPIVLAYEIAQLYMSYQSVYNANIEAFTKVARSTAQTAASIFEFYNPAELDDNRIYSKQFDELSRMWGVAYLYVVEPDAETKSIKYIIIGFGDDAADIARQTRYAGVEVEGGFSDSMQQALTSGEESTVVHEKTELDDTLTCYRVIDTLYDQETEDFAKLDKPYLLGAEISFTSVMKKFQSRFHETAVYDLGFTLLLTVAIFVVFYFRVNGPVKRISAGMKNFVHDREKGVKKLQVKGNDELAEMSRSFNMMTEEIDRYIADIDNLNKEKHTQEAELAIARICTIIRCSTTAACLSPSPTCRARAFPRRCSCRALSRCSISTRCSAILLPVCSGNTTTRSPNSTRTGCSSPPLWRFTTPKRAR